MTSKVTYLGDLRTRQHIQSGNDSSDAPVDNKRKRGVFSPTDTVATLWQLCMMTIME
jgi:hypothetical protein